MGYELLTRQKELSRVAYDGAAALNLLTMPQYPPLQKYFDGVADLLVGDRDTTLYALKRLLLSSLKKAGRKTQTECGKKMAR